MCYLAWCLSLKAVYIHFPSKPRRTKKKNQLQGKKKRLNDERGEWKLKEAQEAAAVTYISNILATELLSQTLPLQMNQNMNLHRLIQVSVIQKQNILLLP